MIWNKSKIIGLSTIAIIIAGLLFLAYPIIHSLKCEIYNLRKDQWILRSLSYQSLPLEKLDTLDFISQENLESGKNEMQKHKVVFAGITRDNARDLPMVMRGIEYLGGLFKDYKVIIFENDSSDGTKVILNLWAMCNPKIKVISQDFHNLKRPSIKFLSDARNKYLNALDDANYNDFDIAIFLDMDMKYGFDPRGIQDSFSKIARWDMVCSNGISDLKGTMHDGFAFRSSLLPHTPQSRKDYWHEYMHDNVQIVYNPSSDLVPVYSCFGGLAIYKRKFLNGCRYDSIQDDCEHVLFHKCMRDKHHARIFMNPTQVVRYRHYR